VVSSIKERRLLERSLAGFSSMKKLLPHLHLVARALPFGDAAKDSISGSASGEEALSTMKKWRYDTPPLPPTMANDFADSVEDAEPDISMTYISIPQ
jgi:hypothetical protein